MLNGFCKASLIMAFLVVLCARTNPNHAAERGLELTIEKAPRENPWGNYHALIVGINSYELWPQLRTARKDAEDLEAVLGERYDFIKERTTLITDQKATRAHIIGMLRKIASELGENDNLLIYFAGHGQLDDLTGEGYWIPVEGKPRDTVTWISHSTVKNILCSEKVTAKNIAVVADSCYSGVLLRGRPASFSVEERSYRKKLALLASRRSRQVVSSGGLEPVVDGGRDGNSLFAYYFLKALRENRRYAIDIENLLNSFVWKYVVEIGGQRPSVGRLRTPMDEDGQFVFVLSRSEILEIGPPVHSGVDENGSTALRDDSSTPRILVDDCEDSDRFNEFGGLWYSFDDRTSTRGSSGLWPPPGEAFIMSPGGAKGSRYCAGVKGSISAPAGKGFIGVGCFLNKAKGASDLSGYHGIIFSFRGTPGRCRFKIHSKATSDYDDFGYDFRVESGWNTLRLPINKLTQEGWGKAVSWSRPGRDGAAQTAVSINWQTLDAPEDPVELYVDNVFFY